MSALSAARGAVHAKLVAAGVDATLDPATPVPFVLVDLATVTGSDGPGGWRGVVPVQIVAAPPGDAAAAAWLEDQCSNVLRALVAATAIPQRYPLSPDVDAPAYLVTYSVTIPNPDC